MVFNHNDRMDIGSATVRQRVIQYGMQTFLPYPDITLSAAVLDYKRLGKQRVEAMQILNALAGLKRGWTNHPAVRMWRGYEDGLAAYHDACISEWIQ